jgi:hypothetical protein
LKFPPRFLVESKSWGRCARLLFSAFDFDFSAQNSFNL